MATVKDKIAKVEDMFARNQDTIMAVLPKHVDKDRLVKVLFNSIRINPKLLDCNPASLMAALINSATLGLEVDTPLGHAHLVPFKGKVVLIIGYKGLIHLANGADSISSVSAVVVYDKEHLVYQEGDRPVLEHTPLPPSKRGKKRIATYSRIILPDGSRPDPCFVWGETVEAIKKSAPGSKSKESPWNGQDHEVEEMWKKTAIRRHFKLLDLDPTINRAVALDEQYEAGLYPRDFTLEGEDYVIDKPEIEPPKELPQEAPTSDEDKTDDKGNGKGKGKEEKPVTGDERTSENEETEETGGNDDDLEVVALIRDLGQALDRTPIDVQALISDCKDAEDLENLRKKLLKEYNAKAKKRAKS